MIRLATSFNTSPPRPVVPALGRAPSSVADLQCRLCGATPAIRGTARQHAGRLLAMRFVHLDGPFCRSCGLAVTRRLSAATLSQGWWGPVSLFVAALTLLANARLLHRLSLLAAPGTPAPGCRPIDPGRSLLRRPQIAGLAVPVTLVLVTAGLAVLARL